MTRTDFPAWARVLLLIPLLCLANFAPRQARSSSAPLVKRARPSPSPMSFAVVVQGSPFSFALDSFASATSFDPVLSGELPVVKILSMLDSARGHPNIALYEALNFSVVFSPVSNAEPLRGSWDGLKVNNHNFQRVTTTAGVRAAAARGATHALKMRADFRIADFNDFRARLYANLDDLQPLWWHRRSYEPDALAGPPYDRPSVDSPADQLYFGPVGLLLDMFDGIQDAPYYDSRIPETALFDTFIARRNLTRHEGCLAMPKLASIIKPGELFWSHQSNFSSSGLVREGITWDVTDIFLTKSLEPQCDPECREFNCPPYKDHHEYPSFSLGLPVPRGGAAS